jgi:outer membrane protein TolC
MKRIEAADARVAATVAERLPSISLSGSLGALRQEVTSGLIKGDFWSLLANLAMPVIDGGRRRAEVERQEAQLAEAVAGYQQAVLNAFRDVEDALVNNAATGQRSIRLAKTARVTEATLRLSTDRYLSGLTDYLPVLSAQRADLEAQRQLLSARRQLLADRISLARALGGEWMREMIDKRLKSEEDSTYEY